MKLIDADALIANLDKALLLARTNEEIADLKLCKEIVRSAPTVSPDEAEGSGNWYDVCVWGNGAHLVASMRCSACNRYHNEVYHYGDPTETARYCPNCGAKMEASDE